MREMIYKPVSQRELLRKGTYKGFKYYVISYGTHPCAYIEIPKSHKYSGIEYSSDIIDIDCHGGLTYSNNSLILNSGEPPIEGWFIGWDYSHLGDWFGAFDYRINYGNKQWTTQEIVQEAKKVIEQLLEVG